MRGEKEGGGSVGCAEFQMSGHPCKAGPCITLCDGCSQRCLSVVDVPDSSNIEMGFFPVEDYICEVTDWKTRANQYLAAVEVIEADT